MHKLLNFIKKSIPWLITVLAIYYAFRGLNWSFFFQKVVSANFTLLFLAVILTITSYLLRAFRWKYFFPSRSFSYTKSFKILILGFFMNNILPARAGELVRAHLGAKVGKLERTLVLATIASERLADGLTISLMFLFSVNFLPSIYNYSINLPFGLYLVSYLFAFICFSVLIVLFLRVYIFRILDIFNAKLNHKIVRYITSRVKIFLNGLEPLFNIKRLPPILFFSLSIWLVELSVFYIIGKSYSVELDIIQSVVFMVAVNFSSLIPAAPGGIGVIEAVAGVTLVSLGYTQEVALALVLSQHIIQYLVIGIPGAVFMIQLKDNLNLLKKKESQS